MTLSGKRRTIAAFVCLGVIVGLFIAYPYLRFEFRKRSEGKCFTQSQHSKHILSIWSGEDALEVYFSPRGGNNCICPDYPAIGVYSKHPTRWIQVVEVNIPTPPSYMELGWNLSGKPHPWIFSDTSQAHRKQGLPFYGQGDVPQPFWDHPCWNYGSDLFRWFSFGKHQQIIWEARLYAVNVNGSLIHAEAGLKWGWLEDSDRRINAIEPSLIPSEQWDRDSLLLEKIYNQWKFSKSILTKQRATEK